MNQTEHSDHNLSLALKGFSFSFVECRPYTAIRHLIPDKQLWWVSRMPTIAQPQTWCKGCVVKTLSIHTPRNFILFHRRQMLHLYSFGGSLERNNVCPWWTLAFIIPEKNRCPYMYCIHACLHTCVQWTYLYFPCMFSETDYIPLLSFLLLPAHPPLSPSCPDCSLFVLLFHTGQHFLPSGNFSFSHIQDLKVCSLHVLLFGPGAQCLCTTGHSHASERKAQFPNVLHSSPASLQPSFPNAKQDYCFHFPGKIVDIFSSLPPPPPLYVHE